MGLEDHEVCRALDGVAYLAENDRTAEDIRKLSEAIDGLDRDCEVVVAPGAMGLSPRLDVDSGVLGQAVRGCFAPARTEAAADLRRVYNTERYHCSDLEITEEYSG